MDISVALLSGLVAGLALAAPLGAIGVLLVQEGMIRGLRRALPGAAAVATVDTLYCAAAVVAGSLLGPVIGGWGPWPRIVGGATLIALGVRGLLSGRRPPAQTFARELGASEHALRRFLLFLGLTAINPATLLYFVALLPGLDQAASPVAARFVFVAGVGIASFGWQTLLVALGAGLRWKTRPAFRTWTVAIGNGAVVTLGAALIVQAL